MNKRITKNLNNEEKRKLVAVSIRDFIDKYSLRIDLEADYQRDKIWSTEERLALLDSIQENIDIPKIYLAEVKNSKEFDYECIDGKQRMSTLIDFFNPKADEKPLTVSIISKTYTYKQLKKERPDDAQKIEDYKLHLLVYEKGFFEEKTENFINKLFRRLQFGIRLNAGETLKSYTGTIRNFIFKDISGDGPFIGKTGLSKKRYQRELALAQICYNSFNKNNDPHEFVRARTADIEDFFEKEQYIEKKDGNLIRIEKVLKIMDTEFGSGADALTGRASVVSAYLFIEDLIIKKKTKTTSQFVKFYLTLLESIRNNMVLLRQYKEPKNQLIMDKFQKYILQASVEPRSIQRRHEFLVEAFAHYTKTKGKIIGDK